MLSAKFKSLTELEQLVDDEIQESLHLDYKSSGALHKSKRDEICKDISALANSDGGTIIYGIRETGHLPKSVDCGVSNQDIDREWLDNILSSNISPKIPEVVITQIPIDDNSSCYAIDVAKSYSGPHQAPDKKYYKRYNFKSSPMDDYEVRDGRMRQLTVSRLVSFEIEVIHRTIFSVVVQNTGAHPAENVKFEFSDELAWEREKPRILEQGTKYFPPGRRFSFWYRSGPEILGKKPKGPIEFSVTVTYFHPELNQNHSETFTFDFRDFLGSESRKELFEGISREIKQGFRDVVRAIEQKRMR